VLTKDHNSKAADLATKEPVTVVDVTHKSLRVLNGILDEMRRQAPELIASSTGQFGNLVRSVATFQAAVVQTHREFQEQQPPSLGESQQSNHDPFAALVARWHRDNGDEEKAERYERMITKQ